MNSKYVLINEITEQILDKSDDLSELKKLALRMSNKKGKSQTLIIKESSSDEIIAQFGLLLD